MVYYYLTDKTPMFLLTQPINDRRKNIKPDERIKESIATLAFIKTCFYQITMSELKRLIGLALQEGWFAHPERFIHYEDVKPAKFGGNGLNILLACLFEESTEVIEKMYECLGRVKSKSQPLTEEEKKALTEFRYPKLKATLFTPSNIREKISTYEMENHRYYPVAKQGMIYYKGAPSTEETVYVQTPEVQKVDGDLSSYIKQSRTEADLCSETITQYFEETTKLESVSNARSQEHRDKLADYRRHLCSLNASALDAGHLIQIKQTQEEYNKLIPDYEGMVTKDNIRKSKEEEEKKQNTIQKEVKEEETKVSK